MSLMRLKIVLGLVCLLHLDGVHSQAEANATEKEVVFPAATNNYKNEITKLFQTKVNLSLKYLYTGIGYGSQIVERPGMAKYLRGKSDERWQEAIDTLKKYVARGGMANDVVQNKHFKFEGKNQLTINAENNTMDYRSDYLQTLEILHRDSKEVATLLNNIHRMIQKSDSPVYDADWSHYAEERLEEEVKHCREVTGDITTLSQMSNSPVAFHVFDSYLA